MRESGIINSQPSTYLPMIILKLTNTSDS